MSKFQIFICEYLHLYELLFMITRVTKKCCHFPVKISKYENFLPRGNWFFDFDKIPVKIIPLKSGRNLTITLTTICISEVMVNKMKKESGSIFLVIRHFQWKEYLKSFPIRYIIAIKLSTFLYPLALCFDNWNTLFSPSDKALFISDFIELTRLFVQLSG